MNTLDWVPVRFDGWTNISVLTLLWIIVSGVAAGRFAPQVLRAAMIYNKERKRNTNGGTVVIAAMERLVGLVSSELVCQFCFWAGILAGRRNGLAVLFLVFIPITKLIQSEILGRIHGALLTTIRIYVRSKGVDAERQYHTSNT